MAWKSITNEMEIISRITDGDETAFTLLFHHYRNLIYSIALRLTHDVSVAEEIVEDVFLIIWEKRENLGDIQNFQAYLTTIARNKAYHVLKDLAKKFCLVELTEMSQIPAVNNAEEFLDEKENILLLNRAVEKLPTQQRKVYQLIKVQCMKREDVAKTLGIHPETVKYHLAQAMKSIRTFCTPYLEIFIGAGLFVFC